MRSLTRLITCHLFISLVSFSCMEDVALVDSKSDETLDDFPVQALNGLGRACASNADCESGFCFMDLAEGTQTCEEECEPEVDSCWGGEVCEMVQSSFICVSPENPENPENPSVSDAECGNGVIDAGEECDGGTDCTVMCTWAEEIRPFCGNGVVERGEECDGAPECSAECTFEEGNVSRPLCGNGIVEGNEECDGGASCTARCTWEEEAPVPFCGNGIVEGNEECDGDFDCSNNCTWEEEDSAPFCGNGIVEGNEECDGDFDCSNNCTWEEDNAAVSAPVCGNGIIETGEECDGGSSCDSRCRRQVIPECTPGDDSIRGDDNDNRIRGCDGSDRLRGMGGNDHITGGTGDDNISGGDGDDELYGRAGNDRLEGDAGNDTLYGGQGDDRLIAGSGRDHLYGGPNNDTYVYKSYSGTAHIYLDGGQEDTLRCADGVTVQRDRLRSNGVLKLVMSNGGEVHVHATSSTNLRVRDCNYSYNP